MRREVYGMLALLFLLSAIFPVSVSGQERTPSDDEVNAIAKQLYCPVCENVPLDVCPTQACEQWRAIIRDKLAQGWTEDQIKTYFVEQYGDRVLATPPARGLNWLVYVLPPLAVLLGSAGLFFVVRSWRRSDDGTNTEGETQPLSIPDDDPYLARLEEELKRRT